MAVHVLLNLTWVLLYIARTYGMPIWCCPLVASSAQQCAPPPLRPFLSQSYWCLLLTADHSDSDFNYSEHRSSVIVCSGWLVKSNQFRRRNSCRLRIISENILNGTVTSIGNFSFMKKGLQTQEQCSTIITKHSEAMLDFRNAKECKDLWIKIIRIRFMFLFSN